MANPPISVCLTTYNRSSVLQSTVDSILAQRAGDFELIISDDNSTDDTEELCRRYVALDGRVRYCRNEHNLAMPGNLNAAMRHAKGIYVANLHDGDVYRPDLLDRWKSALDEVPSASFVFNEYKWCERDGTTRLCGMPFGICVDGREIARHLFATFSSCVWGTVMARRSAYERTGPFDGRFGFISDVDMWLRLAYRNDVAYIAEPLITLTPREPSHPYAFVHWRALLWNFAIYETTLERYADIMPREVAIYRAQFSYRRRMQWLRSLAICVKHGRWDRFWEGLAVLRDADDEWLRILGLTGMRRHVPNWYSQNLWRLAHSPSGAAHVAGAQIGQQ